MNYQKHYDLLIESRKTRDRIQGEYYEKHHALPRSMKGSNDKSNLVYLTAREHYIAHWLLYKANPIQPLAYAFWAMSMQKSRRKLTSKQFERLRKLPRVHKEETKQKIRDAHIGKTFSDEHKRNISESAKHRPMISDETRRKIAEATKRNHTGMKRSEETKKRLSETAITREIKVCPHCGKESTGSNASRWHFDNCLSNPLAAPRKRIHRRTKAQMEEARKGGR